MVKQHQSLVFCVYLAASAAALAQSSYVFQLPGQTGITKQIVGLRDNDFSVQRSVSNANGPSGATRVLATPNGNKFYILAPGGIFSANATLGSITPVTAVTGAATVAEVSPDGKYLLVVSDHFYILKADTNTLAIPTDTGVTAGGTPVSVAVSHDAQTAYVLTNTATGSTVTAVNLNTLEVTGASLNLTSTSSSMVLSPRGLLYVTSNARISEIDPVSLTVTNFGTILLTGPTGPLQFTPDGNTAYFLNRTPCASCSPIFRLNVASHTVTSLAPPADLSSPPTIDQVLVAGNDRVFGWSAESTTLYAITSTPLALTKTVLGALPTGNVVAVAVSNEIPSARYLYLLISDHNFYRVSLATNGIDGTSSLDPVNGTTLSFVPIPAQSGETNLYQINGTQTVEPGASALLIAQAVDNDGRPVFGRPATFSPDTAGQVTIATPSLVTTAGGWVQTAVTAPTASGTYTPTLRVGTATATFNLIVSGSSSGGPSSQISIYDGDGQLLRQNDSTATNQQPLIAKVTDAGGNPVANVLVTFQVTEGPGAVFPLTSTTGADGLAKTDFTTVHIDATFKLSKVTASADTYGSVEFYETTQNATANDNKPPAIDSITPVNRKITIPQGGLLPAAISLRTYANKDGSVIPNVGLRLADPNSPRDFSPIVSCKGLSRGDNNGISRCNVLAACQPTTVLPHIFTALIEVGGGYPFGGGTALGFSLEVTVTNGTASLLTPISGDNQTGNPGNSFTLLARVSDGCGQPSAISGLKWEILQGSAVLSQTQINSDSAGNVLTRVTFGQEPGPVRIQLSGPNLTSIIFNLTNQVLVSGITVVSGGGQTAIVGQPFANPVIFVVRDVNNAPATGLPVTFSTTGSAATFTPASATTDAQGRVQTSVTAGAVPGDIFVTATHKTFTATATLTARPPGPQISGTSFTNAGSGAVGLTPCGLVTVTGSGIAPTFQGTVTGSGFTVAGLSITANNIPAPIQSVSNVNGVQTANFQAPCELAPGFATMVATVNGASTTVSNVPVFAAQPGVFVVDPVKQYGWVVRSVDGSLVTPANPARRGDRLYMILTGLGQVTPAAVTNVTGNGQNVNATIGVQVSGTGVVVSSRRYLAGFLGVYIVEFQIPLDSPVGLDQSLAINATVDNGATIISGNPLFLPGVITAQ